MEDVTSLPWKSKVCLSLKTRPIADNWYRVKRSELSKELLAIHKSNLSVQSSVPNYVTGKKPPPTECFLEDGDDFCVPFFYGIRNFGEDFEDRRRAGSIHEKINIQYAGPPMNEDVLKQVSASDAVFKSLCSVHGSAILALPMGAGKTTVSLHVYHRMCEKFGRIPLLVLVHKEFLMDQWVERIQSCLPNAKVFILHLINFADRYTQR